MSGRDAESVANRSAPWLWIVDNAGRASAAPVILPA